MKKFFADGDAMLNKKDFDRLLGQNDYVSDSLDNHISETGFYPTNQTNGAGYPNNTTTWGAFANLHTGDKFLQIFFDDSNNVYFRSCNENVFRTHGRGFDQIATKSDLATKLIPKDVDINTLTTEGDFFVMSNNMDHFPAGYRNQWYFLNVVNPKEGVNRIKQTVTPDNDDGWIITRTGSYDTGINNVHWNSWLVLDFANGKLLKTN